MSSFTLTVSSSESDSDLKIDGYLEGSEYRLGFSSCVYPNFYVCVFQIEIYQVSLSSINVGLNLKLGFFNLKQ